MCQPEFSEGHISHSDAPCITAFEAFEFQIFAPERLGAWFFFFFFFFFCLPLPPLLLDFPRMGSKKDKSIRKGSLECTTQNKI